VSAVSRAAAVVLGLVIMLLGAACGSDESAESTSEVSATEHNDADVAFATDMIQHHAQALSMVDLTLGRPLDPQVQRLADGIREAQTPEIETMSDWLTDWDVEVPATMRDHLHADHGGGDADLQALEKASDAGFQTRWLELMVEHHEGAVEMAEAEQSDGRYEPAVELAGTIIETQQAEIDRMRSLLAGG
jgi:uncharacterized protein (DUF305 family)